MEDRTARSMLRDWLATAGAIWLALILAGLAAALVRPSALVATLVSFAVYGGLLALYASAAGPGRRSGMAAYLSAGMLYPAIVMALLLGLPTGAIDGAFDWFSVVGAGFGVGIPAAGGPDTPIEFYIPFLILNILGPIIAVITIRDMRRRDRAA